MDDYGNDERRIQLTKDEQKEVVKQAIQEWLDGQFAKFGKYSMGALVSAAIGLILYFWLASHGLKVP